MDAEQQGLYLMTAICCLLSLFSSCILLIICSFTNLWKFSSVRIISYLAGLNMFGSIVLLLPTYKYEFMCSFQGHLLNFSIISQIIFSTLLMHLAYMKIVTNSSFTRIIEIRYLGIALLPALIASLPPFIAENVGNDCWDNKHSPLQDAVGSYGFLVLYLLSGLVAFVFFVSTLINLRKFPKGYQTEEYNEKVEKLKFFGGFTAMYFLIGGIVFTYACMQIYQVERRSMDFLVMCSYSLAGLLMTGVFANSTKVRTGLKNYLGAKNSEVGILREDVDRLSSATEQLSQDLSD